MLDLTKEQLLLEHYPFIIGIDEAGRGPWAGPVVIAGIKLIKDTTYIPGINDSKKLTEKKRDMLYHQLITTHEYFTVISDNTTIDTLGIGIAVTNAMNTIISSSKSPYSLIDGYFKKGTFPQNTECIIDGDALCYCIAAASIIAKYTRDNLMIELDTLYPQYNFKKHKGYGTKEHAQLLAQYGICPIHRKSYKPIKQYL